MENLIAWILMAAISLPVSFVLASGFLHCLLRLMSAGVNPADRQRLHRDVL